MTSRSLKATTAILAALSLLQPLPALAQASQASPGENAGENGAGKATADRIAPNIRTFDEICAEAKIPDARACELHINELLAEAEAEAQAAADAAAQALAEAETAERFATEGEAADQAAAAAEAEQLARAAAEAEARVEQTADVVTRLVAEAEAASRAADESEAAVLDRSETDGAAQSDAEADGAIQAEAEAEAEDEADAQAQAIADAEAAAQAEEGNGAEVQPEVDGDAQAAGEAETNVQTGAEADAAAQSEAAPQALVDAEAPTGAQTEADAHTAGEEEVEAETEVTAQSPARTEATVEECPAESLDLDGTIRCVDTLTSGDIAAIADETGVETDTEVEVTTEAITESTRRSSSEEFSERSPDDEAERRDSSDPVTDGTATAQSDTGLGDLEKAGLVALGAVVVGAILSNGQRVETNTGDRVIVVDDAGSYRVLKDDDALLRQPGSEIRTERFSDGSTRTTVTRDDGTQIITIRDSTGRALRRVRVDPDGREYLLIDDTREFEPVAVQDLPRPIDDDFDYRAASDRESLRRALLAAERRDLGRSFSLRQVRDYSEVRELAPEINLEAITFATNSAALDPSQAERLRRIGLVMRELIDDDPTEVFLIEGHTDAVGNTGHNLLLSDRRAESVALAFTEYFAVPPENMVVQGYGEGFLKIQTQEAERLNRRVAVRRITPLLHRY